MRPKNTVRYRGRTVASYLPAETVERGLLLYDRGFPIAAVAEILDVSAMAVYNWTKAAGIARDRGTAQRRRHAKATRPGRERIEKIRRVCAAVMLRRLDGKFPVVKAVAEAEGIARNTVYKYLRSEHNPYPADAWIQRPEQAREAA